MRPGIGRHVRVWAASVQPATGALVMSTGILSVGFADAGRDVLSWALLALAALQWVGLTVLVDVKALTDWDGLVAAERTPGALTAVAATAVLGSRIALLGWHLLGWALLALAAALWGLLAPVVFLHHPARTPGSRFLLTVATQGLVVLGVPLVATTGSPQGGYVLLALLALGLLLYLEALRTFDWQQIREGAGDQWVAGGALSISSLATATVGQFRDALRLPGWVDGPLRILDLTLWSAAVAFLLVLTVGEAVRLRLDYSVKRWATVFPLGMTAAASVAVGAVTQVTGIEVVGHALVWAAALVWAVVGAGGVRALVGHRAHATRVRAARPDPPPSRTSAAAPPGEPQ